MWIVRLALRRPYTFVVTALLLLLLTPFVLLRTPTDIFPAINIPVVSVVWLYNGLSAQEIEQRLIYNHERMITTLVNDIEHIESTAYNGAGVIKVYLQPGAQTTYIGQLGLSLGRRQILLPPDDDGDKGKTAKREAKPVEGHRAKALFHADLLGHKRRAPDHGDQQEQQLVFEGSLALGIRFARGVHRVPHLSRIGWPQKIRETSIKPLILWVSIFRLIPLRSAHSWWNQSGRVRWNFSRSL
jgi:hypothetical protein